MRLRARKRTCANRHRQSSRSRGHHSSFPLFSLLRPLHAVGRRTNDRSRAVAREAARAQRGRFPTHRPAFRIDRSRNQSSTARAPRDAASRVPRDAIDRSRVIHSKHIFDPRARPTLAPSSTRASFAPIAIAATDARCPDHPRRRPLHRARIERIASSASAHRAHPKSACAMSRTLYSRPALDVSMTHMEDDMMDVDEKFPSRAESDVEARARLLVRARRRRLSW